MRVPLPRPRLSSAVALVLGLLLWPAGGLGQAPAPPRDYPVRPVPFTDLFVRAAPVLRGEEPAHRNPPGYPFDDSDVYKVIEHHLPTGKRSLLDVAVSRRTCWSGRSGRAGGRRGPATRSPRWAW